MIRAVYSSNFTERTGLGLDQTTEICKRNFAGEKVVAKEVGTVSYVGARNYLGGKKRTRMILFRYSHLRQGIGGFQG